MVIASPRGLHC